jgi:hypothetical protein
MASSKILQVLAMKGLPPSQKEERGLDLKKKCLGSMAEPAGFVSSGFRISTILKNIPKRMSILFVSDFCRLIRRQHVGVIFLHRPYPDFLLEPCRMSREQ